MEWNYNKINTLFKDKQGGPVVEFIDIAERFNGEVGFHKSVKVIDSVMEQIS